MTNELRTLRASALRNFAGANNTISEEQMEESVAAYLPLKLEEVNHPSRELPLAPSGFHEMLHRFEQAVDFCTLLSIQILVLLSFALPLLTLEDTVPKLHHTFDHIEESEHHDRLYDGNNRQGDAASLKSIKPSLHTGFRSPLRGEQRRGENGQQQSRTVSDPLPTARVLGGDG